MSKFPNFLTLTYSLGSYLSNDTKKPTFQPKILAFLPSQKSHKILHKMGGKDIRFDGSAHFSKGLQPIFSAILTKFLHRCTPIYLIIEYMKQNWRKNGLSEKSYVPIWLHCATMKIEYNITLRIIIHDLHYEAK